MHEFNKKDKSNFIFEKNLALKAYGLFESSNFVSFLRGKIDENITFFINKNDKTSFDEGVENGI